MAMEIKVVFEETAQEMAVGFENLQIIDASEGSLVPEGTLTITENGTYDVAQFATADVDVPIPDGYLKPDGTLVATQEGVYDVAQYASADFSVQKQQASIIPTQETQTITPSEKAFFDKVVVEAIPSEYIVPDGVLAIDSNGEYDVTSYAQAVVNTPDMSGTPIEVAELPTPTAEDIGKVYLNTRDGEYYVGEESVVSWTVGEPLGDKVYFDTSVNPIDYIKTPDAVIFACSDETETNGWGLLMQTVRMDDQYLIIIAAIIPNGGIHAFVYADTNMATIEEFNQQFGTAITAYGWQMEELDTSLWAYCATQINELSDYGNFAYKSKTLTFKPLDEPPVLQEKTATENGEVVADSGFDGLSKVTIDVQPSLEQTTITENGTFTPSGGYDGFSSVTVDVPTPVFKTQEKTVTENGVVTPDDGYDGLSKVTVEVASTGGGEAQATLDAMIDGSITEIVSDVIRVGSGAFTSRSKLTSANFPNATYVGGAAFNACNTLKFAILPYCNNVYASTFASCNSLTKVIIGTNLSTVVPLAITNAFNNCFHILGTTNSTYNPTGAKDGYIYVPHSLVADYRVATNWATFTTQIMPYVATIDELASIDGTTYDKACVGDDYTEYTYNGTSWEVYIR